MGIIILVWLIFSIVMYFYKASRPGGFLSGPYIGVVNIEGTIIDSRPALEWIERLERDSNAVGVLVRVESPGGAVTPSEEIYTALNRLAATRPVVASLGTMATSGGYMVALPAKSIVANPTTLTGSVGVRLEMPNMQELMGKIGITHESLTTGELKSAGSPFVDLTDKDREYFLGLIQDMFDRFVSLVEKHRTLDSVALNLITDGRAVTGRQALELGMVDSLGDKAQAVHILKELCGIKKELTLVEGPEPDKPSILRLILGVSGLEHTIKLLERLAGEVNEPGVLRFYYY
jgi:protease-4